MQPCSSGLLDRSLSRPPLVFGFWHGDWIACVRSATAIDRFFFYVCFPVFHCSGALLSWIDVINKWMSSLDSQTCVGMASVKKNLWHFPKSKMAAGVVYCYSSPCPFESFSWSILEGSKLFLRVPWSPYRSRRGHHEVYSSPVVHAKRTSYCEPLKHVLFRKRDMRSTLTQSVILKLNLCNKTTVKLNNKQIYVRLSRGYIHWRSEDPIKNFVRVLVVFFADCHKPGFPYLVCELSIQSQKLYWCLLDIRLLTVLPGTTLVCKNYVLNYSRALSRAKRA